MGPQQSGTRAKIRPRGQEAYRRPPRQGAEREDRDPVVPEPSGDRGQRGRRRIGQARRGRAGRPRSRMVLDHEPGRFSQREKIPPAALACQRQARLLRAEVGRCQGLGQEAALPGQEPQVTPLREAEAGPHGVEGQQAPRLAVLPAEDGALLDRPVSGLDNPPTGRHLLVVPVQHPDLGATVQELPPMEEPAEPFCTEDGTRHTFDEGEEITSVDNETGGVEEFVVVDQIAVAEQKFLSIIEAKRTSVGQAIRQLLLPLKDAWDNNGGGVVHGFVTTGQHWRMFSYDGISLQDR